jgi:hypothetical protein
MLPLEVVGPCASLSTLPDTSRRVFWQPAAATAANSCDQNDGLLGMLAVAVAMAARVAVFICRKILDIA